MNDHLELIAASEDEPIAWFRRDPERGPYGEAAEAFAARRAARQVLCDFPLFMLRVTRQHMRPFALGDCTAEHHSEDREVAEELGCYCDCHIFEGWHLICDPSHLDAIPVWRVEARGEDSAGMFWWRVECYYSRGRRALRDLDPRRPLRTPAIWRLSRRPFEWEAHPHQDLMRRGEREWVSGLQRLSGGIVTRKGPLALSMSEARRRMGLPPT